MIKVQVGMFFATCKVQLNARVLDLGTDFSVGTQECGGGTVE